MTARLRAMNSQKQVDHSHKKRMQKAYLTARKQLQVAEIELNRSSLAIVNQDGEVVRLPMLNEH